MEVSAGPPLPPSPASLDSKAPLDDSVRLSQLEDLAETFYNTTDPGARRQAQIALSPFSNSSDCISQCQLLIDHSRKPYALLLAASSLLRLITQFWNSFSVEKTVDIRNYLLNYLASNCENLPKFVQAALIQVICRIAKLGWISFQHQEICNDVSKFLEHSLSHCILGLQILIELVDEMNHAIPGETISAHRKIAVAFRDKALLYVFQISLTSLNQLLQSPKHGVDAELHTKCQMQSMVLSLKCLSFDYIGTCSDESTEEFGSLQIPSSWRTTVEDASTLLLFFGIITNSTGAHVSKCMEIVVQLASIRRSLFSSEDLRKKYLQCLLKSSSDIIESHSHILADKEAYIHFCRLLVAIKANYQLQDLANLDIYGTWIRSVATFTVTSFANWEWVGSATHYLVTLWARLTLSIPYMRGDLNTYLDTLVPQVTQAFIDTRMKAVAKAIEDDDAELFFEEGSIAENLHYIPTLCRHVYPSTFSFLCSRLDPLLQSYREAVELLRSERTVNSAFWQKLILTEGPLAWLIYITGSVIAGQVTSTPSREDQMTIDGQLCARIFLLVDQVTFRVTTAESMSVACAPFVDQALLYFMQQFRKAHVGQESITRGIRVMDSSTSTEPQIFLAMSELLGTSSDQISILNLILQKIVSVLRLWSQHVSMCSEALTLLHDLSSGYTSAKLLLQCDAATSILSSHGNASVFPFMDVQANSKLRTKFYITWGRMIMADSNIGFFDQFMEPFEQRLDFLHQHSNFRSDEVRRLGVGLMRDLRGIVQSTYNKTAYIMFFEWIYPRYFGQVLRLLESLWDIPTVATPVLRFVAEFVLNRTQRISFSPSAPNGIILFQESSKMISIYGNRILSCSDPIGDVYKDRYKGIGLCMDILFNGLSGDYSNFGVFRLYNDPCLQTAFQTCIKLILLFPLPELLAFKKISMKYFTLLEILYRNHISLFVQLDTPVFLALLSSLSDGIASFDIRISSLAATAVDNVATFVFKEKNKKSGRGDTASFVMFEKHMAHSGDIFPSFLQLLLGLIVFESAPNHWSLSRPVLSLILDMEQAFNQYKQDLVCAQVLDMQPLIVAAFERLMEGIRPSLDNRNRDKFTQNLTLFRNDLRKLGIKPIGT